MHRNRQHSEKTNTRNHWQRAYLMGLSGFDASTCQSGTSCAWCSDADGRIWSMVSSSAEKHERRDAWITQRLRLSHGSENRTLWVNVSVLTMSTSRTSLSSCSRPSGLNVSFRTSSRIPAAVTQEQATADGRKTENFSSETHNTDSHTSTLKPRPENKTDQSYRSNRSSAAVRRSSCCVPF